MATTKKNELVKVEPGIIEALDSAIERGIAAQGMAGKMSRALAVAGAVQDLRLALDTPGVMDSVMALQGSALGFRTDKDSAGGYPVDVVRDCSIDAALQGCYHVGNEFNIIASRCYITKEGMGRKLSSIEGLGYVITPGVPKTAQGGAIVDMEVSWSYRGKTCAKTLPVCVRVNAGMGTDAILGKATRKARAWLFQAVTGQEVPDGDVDDATNITPAKSPFEKGASPSAPDTQAKTTPLDPVAKWKEVIENSPLTMEQWCRYAASRGEEPSELHAERWLENSGKYINSALDWLEKTDSL